MKKTIYLLLAAISLLALLGTGMVLAFRSLTLQALAPITDTTNALQTQVAKAIHPTPTILPDPVTIINDVRSLARLETIQYSVEKIITAESGQEVFGPLFGDRLLFVAHGVVIAGVDLSRLEVSDLSLRDSVLMVRLPDAEVFIATLNNKKSYVYDRQTGLFTKGGQDLETLARQAAEEEIYNAALEDGILDQAAVNAEAYLLKLFNTLGFENVVFE
ncbi:MAG: DUF4230 domain-containing protein [Anaerolineaceae bacterium]|nr:DUF4230 domain-containing protein [Anaerolineaceae bacterium]